MRDVVDRAYPAGEKAYTTVQTAMDTLARKGILRRRELALVTFYRPELAQIRRLLRERVPELAGGTEEGTS